jgi:FlaA1/EpsC-like NDP-sugar epimerase
LGFRPIGFLDDDPFIIGRQIHGIEILGGIDQLETILDARSVDGVVVTTDMNGNASSLKKVLDISRAQGRWVRSLKLEFELLE